MPKALREVGKGIFDVWVFNPLAPTNLKHQLDSCYRQHETEKRRQYDERVHEVEGGSFAPLVFATSGGMGRQASFTNAWPPC